LRVLLLNQKLKVMKKLLVILITVVSFHGMAQVNPKYLNVMAVNGLNMRSEPDSKSRVVTKVAYGKRVEILEKTKVELLLGWTSDNWYRVRYRGREGFIYGGYLGSLKPPANLEVQNLADMIPQYCTQAFSVAGAPTKTVELTEKGDTLTHTLVRFANGAEMELEQQKGRRSSLLILPATVQETYVLLEALLKRSGNKELLNELRFVKNKDGLLGRINNANGTISIKPYSNGMTAINLVSHS